MCKIFDQKGRHFGLGIFLKQQTVSQTQPDVNIKISLTFVQISGLRKRIAAGSGHSVTNTAGIQPALSAIDGIDLKTGVSQNESQLVRIFLHADAIGYSQFFKSFDLKRSVKSPLYSSGESSALP